MEHILEAAALIAMRVHKDQTRACGVEPYINHCKRVAGMFARDFPKLATDEYIAAAILHDTLEDCPYNLYTEIYVDILNRCGPFVAASVELLTKPRDFKEYSNIRYLNMLRLSPPSIQTIKAVDRIDNLNTIPSTNWNVERRKHYIEDSIKIRDMLHGNMLTKQAEILNVHIATATSSLRTDIYWTKHG